MEEENLVIIESRYPYLTAEDVRDSAVDDLGELSSSYEVLTEKELRARMSDYLHREGVTLGPRIVIPPLSEKLVVESGIPKSFSFPKVLRKLEKKGISDEYVEDIENENMLWDWKRFLGILPCVYEDGHALKIFSFLTGVLEKRNLYDAFSMMTSGPQDVTDKEKKIELYKLKMLYNLVDSDEDLWFPRKFTPLELTKNIKSICRKEGAPKELKKILNRYLVEFIEEKKSERKVSEIHVHSEGSFEASDLRKIYEFLREIRLEPEKLELGILREIKLKPEKYKMNYGETHYVQHIYGPADCTYSLRYRGLTYGHAEELRQFIEDNLPVKSACII